MASLHTIDLDLWKEALFVGNRIPSIPQHVKLSKKSLATGLDMFGDLVFPPHRGFPQRQITGPDWLKLQYLVLKIPYANASIRDEFQNPTVVKLRIPSALGAPLNQMLEHHGKNGMLQNTLARVRYDFVHVPKIRSGKGGIYTIRISELSMAFPYATHAWAEAAGPYESDADMEVVRAFNISRRFAEGGRKKHMEDLVASVAAQGGVIIKKEWNDSVKKRLRAAMKPFKALRKEPDRGYWKKNGDFVNGTRVELQCDGCYAKFVSSRQYPPGRLDSWKVYDTRREFHEHRHRASANRGALALC